MKVWCCLTKFSVNQNQNPVSFLSLVVSSGSCIETRTVQKGTANEWLHSISGLHFAMAKCLFPYSNSKSTRTVYAFKFAIFTESMEVW